MANFPPVDEQLAYIKKGAAEIVKESELRAKLERSLTSGKPLRVKAGFDPTAPAASGTHRSAAQAQTFSGSRAHGHLSDRGFYRDDWRSDGALGHASSAVARAD